MPPKRVAALEFVNLSFQYQFLDEWKVRLWKKKIKSTRYCKILAIV